MPGKEIVSSVRHLTFAVRQDTPFIYDSYIDQICSFRHGGAFVKTEYFLCVSTLYPMK